MLRNYLKIATRNLRRHPFYAAINLTGLGVGLACCLLIMVFVQHEFGVNRQFEKSDTVYRINRVLHEQGNTVSLVSYAPLAQTLKTEVAGVTNAVRYTGIGADIRVGETPFRVPILIVGPELFELFDFQFIAGDPETALQQPNAVVLTEPEAIKLFGHTDVLGEVLRIATWGGDGEQVFQVTGVIERPAYNSITYIGQNENGILVPFANANDFFEGAAFDTDWRILNTVTYVELSEEMPPKALEALLPSVVERNLPTSFDQGVSLQVESLRDVYLNEGGGAARRLAQLLSLVALLIIGVACFNYINVSTALAVSRAKEVGMRKVLGASRVQLVGQYLGESVLVCGVGMLLGVGLAQLGVAPFNALVERTLAVPYSSPLFWLLIAGGTLLVGVVGGVYPAFYLAAAQPAKSLKTLARSGKTAARIRRGLVVVQFTIAIGLFVAAVVVSRQATFIAEQDVGFDREQVLAVSSLPREWTPSGVQKLDVIKRTVQDIAEVEHVSIAWGPPGPRYTGITWDFVPEGGDAEHPLSVPISHVDPDFLATMGIGLAAGAFFEPSQADPEPVVVLNETAARMFGWEQPVGQYITTNEATYRVLGVVKDYHTEGLERPIGPLALVDVRHVPLYRELLIRLPAEGAETHLAAVRTAWAEVYPSVAFDYYFVDQQWHDQHTWIWRTKTIAELAALLALFVACLGLLGIVSISVGQRRQEIGIRKVVGASLPSVVRLLSIDFLKLVGVAIILATPLAYLAMHRWLAGFANRIDLEAGVFVWGSLFVLAIAGITVLMQSLRAALLNPVDALKDE